MECASHHSKHGRRPQIQVGGRLTGDPIELAALRGLGWMFSSTTGIAKWCDPVPSAESALKVAEARLVLAAAASGAAAGEAAAAGGGSALKTMAPKTKAPVVATPAAAVQAAAARAAELWAAELGARVARTSLEKATKRHDARVCSSDVDRHV